MKELKSEEVFEVLSANCFYKDYEAGEEKICHREYPISRIGCCMEDCPLIKEYLQKDVSLCKD